ncbi:hypothetical protein K432DRAFT_436517 [Lepidopterella palustris CBS 459.81]|uniref:SH3 domain signaling protein n=1 Tax=Lepidopterella palustris CBS 459.81 TaxID=1314670 RepID=A0A8E2JCX9_9PEZI|nr:hypothetical protein K432DRAFT_436517 [Lepidopterella palustris CBS 459.81]
MQRVQRKIGSFLPRKVVDAGDVAAMLRDFEDADQMLVKIADASKAWRDAWTDILNHQLGMLDEFLIMYKPLGGKSESLTGHQPVTTPPSTLERVAKLDEAYSELKTDMLEEIRSIDSRLIAPAKSARESIKPMKKVIKKREDKKLDYERYKGRVDSLQKKQNRSDRDNSALAKHEADLARTSQEYEIADESLRANLPGIVSATFSLLPHLLANQVVLQNNLLGNLYTVLHQYSQDHGFPNPPPELEEVVPVWDAEFTSLRKELETNFDMIARGKAIHQPMRLPDQGSTLTGLGIRNKVIPGRRSSSNSTVPTIHATSPKPNYNQPTFSEPSPPVGLSNKPSYSSLNASKPRIRSHSPGLSSSPGPEAAWSQRPSTASSTSGQSDYFAKPRIPSSSSASFLSPGAVNPALGKKKPPPPPPKKIGSFQGEFVTAMYDFDGLNAGDLPFREGDRIKVLKKTQSSHDWWEGELGGQRGSFPANYCK